jgi:hypothetical protein
MYYVHTIWKILHVDKDEQQWIDIGAWKGPNGHNRTSETGQTDVDKRQTEVDEHWTNVSYDDQQL